MNKAVILVSLSLLLSACGSSGDGGSDRSTYSSCKITTSKALLAEDRLKDTRKCWNASGGGIESKQRALDWCEDKVQEYIADTYIFGHTVTYSIQSTDCN